MLSRRVICTLVLLAIAASALGNKLDAELKLIASLLEENLASDAEDSAAQQDLVAPTPTPAPVCIRARCEKYPSGQPIWLPNVSNDCMKRYGSMLQSSKLDCELKYCKTTCLSYDVKDRIIVDDKCFTKVCNKGNGIPAWTPNVSANCRNNYSSLSRTEQAKCETDYCNNWICIPKPGFKVSERIDEAENTSDEAGIFDVITAN